MPGVGRRCHTFPSLQPRQPGPAVVRAAASPCLRASAAREAQTPLVHDSRAGFPCFDVHWTPLRSSLRWTLERGVPWHLHLVFLYSQLFCGYQRLRTTGLGINPSVPRTLPYAGPWLLETLSPGRQKPRRRGASHHRELVPGDLACGCTSAGHYLTSSLSLSDFPILSRLAKCSFVLPTLVLPEIAVLPERGRFQAAPRLLLCWLHPSSHLLPPLWRKDIQPERLGIKDGFSGGFTFKRAAW